MVLGWVVHGGLPTWSEGLPRRGRGPGLTTGSDVPTEVTMVCCGVLPFAHHDTRIPIRLSTVLVKPGNRCPRNAVLDARSLRSRLPPRSRRRLARTVRLDPLVCERRDGWSCLPKESGTTSQDHGDAARGDPDRLHRCSCALPRSCGPGSKRCAFSKRWPQPKGSSENALVYLFESIDTILAGVVLLQVGLGLWELCVGDLVLPDSLATHTFDELEAKVAGTLVLVLVVRFLEVLVQSPEPEQLLASGVSITLVGGLLVVFMRWRG